MLDAARGLALVRCACGWHLDLRCGDTGLFEEHGMFVSDAVRMWCVCVCVFCRLRLNGCFANLPEGTVRRLFEDGVHQSSVRVGPDVVICDSQLLGNSAVAPHCRLCEYMCWYVE